MLQNHMFQLLAMVAMEPPVSFEADAVRDEKSKLLRAVQPLTPEEVLTHTVRGQYGEGGVKGEHLPIARNPAWLRTGTETFAALKLMIDNWRWADVPFYLRTGNAYPSA